MEKQKRKLKGKTINSKENHKPKGKTSRLSLLAHPLSLATVCICLHLSLTTCEIRDVAKLSIESNYRLKHRVLSCCDMNPSPCKHSGSSFTACWMIGTPLFPIFLSWCVNIFVLSSNILSQCGSRPSIIGSSSRTLHLRCRRRRNCYLLSWEWQAGWVLGCHSAYNQ